MNQQPTSQSPNGINPDFIIADVLSRWPQTISIFIQYHMSCVGCAMAPFETLADAASIYGLPLDGLLAQLNHRALSGSQPESDG
jgi:hybrid cluster-associated redox disulfide protein